jgi:wyosine [tRNA(Phe)-imidazoG37] synthetase (radical SAM superfamily)
MPSHNEIREFSQELADRTGLRILGEQRASRVVVMGKDREKLRIR